MALITKFVPFSSHPFPLVPSFLKNTPVCLFAQLPGPSDILYLSKYCRYSFEISKSHILSDGKSNLF